MCLGTGQVSLYVNDASTKAAAGMRQLAAAVIYSRSLVDFGGIPKKLIFDNNPHMDQVNLAGAKIGCANIRSG
eukprot:5375374-Pyramimonas_sp.AAC.1